MQWDPIAQAHVEFGDVATELPSQRIHLLITAHHQQTAHSQLSATAHHHHHHHQLIHAMLPNSDVASTLILSKKILLEITAHALTLPLVAALLHIKQSSNVIRLVPHAHAEFMDAAQTQQLKRLTLWVTTVLAVLLDAARTLISLRMTQQEAYVHVNPQISDVAQVLLKHKSIPSDLTVLVEQPLGLLHAHACLKLALFATLITKTDQLPLYSNMLELVE